MDRIQVADKLAYYASLEGTEIGEVWEALSRLARYLEYLPDDFRRALEYEMDEQLKLIADQTVVVTKEVTTTHTETWLEWVNE